MKINVNRKFRRSLLLILLILFNLSIFSQSPHFKEYKIYKNKKDYTVNVIYQDHSGYMWFGTNVGLVKFDGLEYIYFTTENGLFNNHITALYQDQNDILWIGDKKGGLCKYKNNTIELFDPEEGLSSEAITDIFVDSKNTLWFSTEGEGIYYYTGEIKRMYNLWTDEGISDHVYCIEEDSEGNIWIGTDNGISIFNVKDKKIKNLSMKDGLPDNIVKHIESGDNNFMRIGMEESGIILCDIKTYKFSDHRTLKMGSLNNFISKNNSELWISTKSNGISRLTDTKSTYDYHYFTDKNGLINNSTNTVFIDREKNLWIGSKNGITQCNLNTFEFLTKKDGLYAEKIYALIKTEKNKQWLCSDQGLLLLDKNNMGEISLKKIFKDKHPNTAFISLYYDKTGNLWAGTYNEGVFKIDPKTLDYKQYTEKDGLANNNIISITGDENTIWLSTLGGGASFTSIDHIKFNTINSQNGLASDYVYQIFIDSKKRKWFAQDGGGLTVLQNEEYINYNEDSGLNSGSIYSITEDSENTIWIVSSDKGIYEFDGKTFKNYSVEDGLITSIYSGISYKGENELLLISNEGIELFNTENKSITYFGEESGVAYLEPSLNAIFKDLSNNFWIGTNQGIIKYDYRNKEEEIVSPKIIITKKQAYFNEITDTIVNLNYNQNHLIFNYTGLWFKAPDKLKYRHKLEGFDIDWIYSGNSKTQTYSNLPPGDYSFIVEVSHLPGIWNGSKEATFSFKIKPPFWRTWWFISVTVIFIIFFIYTIFKIRLRKLTKAKEELEAEVRRRTEKIMNQKEEIETQKDEIEYQNNEIRHSINYAGRIQSALIKTVLNDNITTEHFTLWKPRDVVSGDFYWIKEINEKQFFIAADCTGHGVPGAFMSMLGISFLDELILRRDNENPSVILEEMRKQIKLSLKQTGEIAEQKDGMDMAICVIDKTNLKLQYSGAYNPMYLIRNNKFFEYKATRNPVGVYAKEIPFKNYEIQLEKDDMIYIFSDGYHDQFGGEKGQKYKSRNFKHFIEKIHKNPINEQKQLLENELSDWMGNNSPQIDDILIIGIKLL